MVKLNRFWNFIAIIIIVILFGTSKNISAQYVLDYRTPDSTHINTHSPNKATFYSAILPGLGQIYNKKYWKVPIIYAGFGGLFYYLNYNSYVYDTYKEAYSIKLRIEDGELGLEDEDRFPDASLETIQGQKDNWRRNRDLSFIGIGLLYAIQIIDADVDANLFDYNISEDLSMRLDPIILNNPVYKSNYNSSSTLGLRCSIKF